MFKHNCDFCGKESEYKYRSHIKRYCSHQCSNSAHWLTRESGKTEKIICKTCGKEFSIMSSVKRARENNGSKVQYCSRTCMGIGSKKAKIVLCKNCGKEFETTRSIFCSKKCSGESRKKYGIAKKNGYWMENGYKVIYLDGNKSIKEHIKIMQDSIGRELTEDEVVHHIDEDRLNNDIGNLRLMTRGEHSRLHRNKEKADGKHLFGGHNNN